MTILYIDSNILGGHSASRLLSGAIVVRQLALHPGYLRGLYVDGACRPACRGGAAPSFHTQG